MVEYQDDANHTDDAAAKAAPTRRRRTFRPMAAAGAVIDALTPNPVPTRDDYIPAGGEPIEEEDVIVPPTADTTEPAPEPSSAPPAEPTAATPDLAAPDAAEAPEQPPAAARSRPPLAVLFQAPPALPEPAALPPIHPPVDASDDDEDDDDDDSAGGPASRRSRRRTRRRPGGAGESESTVVTEVVQKVRPARELITEPQRLKGSTRLEAKRQRRRDGRDAGRRRTVVTEAEFLARREAVDRVLLVRNTADRIEIGVLEDGILAEHYVAKSQNVSLIGNVYLGRVQNVLPSMEAAFVDIGRGRNAVLYSGEVDWEAASDRLGDKGPQARRIELALKSGDKVLVQVTKDPIGHKGARLTSAVSLPGRYLVYVPNGSMNGISRKLPDTERARLKKILKDALPDSAGVIVRTAAEGATEEQLTIDVQRLANQWAEIDHLVQTATAPSMLHGEPDLLVKIVRDVFNEDFAKLIVEGDDARATIERYLNQVAPDLLDRLEQWTGDGDVFTAHRVHEQIEKALDRKVWLPSGGSLVIDRTEAMTVVDVNTGKFVGSGGNLEETVTKNNLEAAEEIVRQLRLRDIGGIIVVDFIDMVLETNRDLVLRRLVECLSRDRTKHQVAEVTSLGLVQMTRKRLGVGLAESVSDAPAPDAKPEPNARRRRGGGQPPTNQPPQRPVSTHVITDGAKTALAQIAGATIVPSRTEHHAEPAAAAPAFESPAPVSDAPAGDVVSDAVSAASEALAPAPISSAPTEADHSSAGSEPRSVDPERRSGSRRASTRGRTVSTVLESPQHAETAVADVQQPSSEVPPAMLLDIPVEAHQRAAARLPKADAEGLLDSVLGALPEPKAAGQGRRRSRRVSTPALTPGESD